MLTSFDVTIDYKYLQFQMTIWRVASVVAGMLFQRTRLTVNVKGNAVFAKSWQMASVVVWILRKRNINSILTIICTAY